MAKDGTGTTLTCSTSGFTAALTKVKWGGIKRKSLPTTSLATTGGHTSMPATLVDYGEIDIAGYCATSATVPITTAAENMSISWAGTGTASAGSGYFTDVEIGDATNDETIPFTAKIKCTGTWTGLKV